MPRTKGSKNRPKTTHTDYASQIAEKQESIVSLTAEIAIEMLRGVDGKHIVETMSPEFVGFVQDAYRSLRYRRK